MENKEAIRRHYNKISNKSVEERRKSMSINIRSANNFIKLCLLKAYVTPSDTVLELGVGKGGDFKKYQSLDVTEVYGLDIANRSILDALKRAREMAVKFKLTLKIKDCFSTELNLRRQFNIVSLQFTFHYCFDSEKNVNTTMGNIARHLKPGGKALITVPWKEEILRRKKAGRLSNRFYSIKFKENSDEIYGNTYYYTLVDSVNDCLEYLVDTRTLVSKANERGLELVQCVSFQSFFEDSRSLYQGIYQRLVSTELTYEEKEVVYLYQIIVLKKI